MHQGTMAWRKLFCLISIILIEFSIAQDLDLVEVFPDVGPIVGFRYQYDVDDGDVQLSKTIDTFLGIPYGEPPIAEGRFRKPQAKKEWTEPWNATFDRPMCWQVPVDVPGLPYQDEDCLYLNVWSPDVTVCITTGYCRRCRRRSLRQGGPQPILKVFL